MDIRGKSLKYGEKEKRTVKKDFTTSVADRLENNKYKKEEWVILKEFWRNFKWPSCVERHICVTNCH